MNVTAYMELRPKYPPLDEVRSYCYTSSLNLILALKALTKNCEHTFTDSLSHLTFVQLYDM